MKQFGSPAEIIIITPPFSIWAIRLLQAQTHTEVIGALVPLNFLSNSACWIYEESEIQKAVNVVNTLMLF